MREPGGELYAEGIRELIISDRMKGMEPLAELMLFCAARSQVMATRVRPLLEQGSWVLTDRNLLSSIIYQGCVKGVPLKDVEDVCKIAVGDCLPDLILVLDVPEDVSLQRRRVAGGVNRFEEEGVTFHKRINQAYRDQGKMRGYPTIDGSASILKVTDELWEFVSPLL